MGKIFEALEQADRDRENSKKSIIETPDTQNFQDHLDLLIDEQTMTSLYQNIISLVSNKKNIIIQFIGSRDGEGTSTLLKEFAKYIAVKLEKSVLLIDSIFQQPSLADFYNVRPECLGDEEIDNDKPPKEAFCQISMSSLFIGQISMNGDLSRIGSLFDSLKRDFEFIFICSPGIMDNQNDLIFSRLVDGVVLVVEAEKTRWQVVDIVKEKIEIQGGNILGVVLNKRRYHIPEFIYKWI